MPDQLNAVLRAIDDANAADPRREQVGADAHPFELVYAQRMTACLAELYPNASPALRIAARGQHICRWQIPRSDYPLGREGYNAWRTACRNHHASLVTAIMEREGYPADERGRVANIICKQHLKSDPDAQALENVVGVVFARHYLDDFARKHADYPADKMLAILRKTLRKMDATGIDALKRSALPAHLASAIEAALAPSTG